MLEVLFFLFCLSCNGQDWYRPSKFVPYSLRTFKHPPVISFFKARARCFSEGGILFYVQNDYATKLRHLRTYLRQDKTSVPGFEDQKLYVGAKRHHIAENNDPFFWFLKIKGKIVRVPVSLDLLRFEVAAGRPNPKISRDSRDCLAARYAGTLYFYDVKCSEMLGGICEKKEDVDECELKIHNCDKKHGKCINTQGSYVCSCKSGWTGNGITCTDVNECSETKSCNPHAKCFNMPGSYKCSCFKGYSGNGQTCTDINECQLNLHNCHKRSTCVNTKGSYVCNCRAGYTGDGFVCRDVNECSRPRKCDSHANCINMRGTYKCSCFNGYSGNGRKCTDINECQLNLDNCHQNSTCVNTKGSYVCNCRAGYTGDGFVCRDIDECAESYHRCHAQSSCHNNLGSYFCKCLLNWVGDGFTCKQVETVNIGGIEWGSKRIFIFTVLTFFLVTGYIGSIFYAGGLYLHRNKKRIKKGHDRTGNSSFGNRFHPSKRTYYNYTYDNPRSFYYNTSHPNISYSSYY